MVEKDVEEEKGNDLVLSIDIDIQQKVDEILKDAISSSSQKSGDVVTVTIEGELP